MRIAFLMESLAMGGAEVHTFTLANVLKSRGHNIIIVQFSSRFLDSNYERWGFSPTEIRKIILNKSLSQIGLFEAVKILSKIKCDKAIFVKCWLTQGTFRFELAARWVFPRYLTIVHSPPVRKTKRNLLKGLGLRKTLRCLPPKYIISVSNVIKNILVKDYKCPESKVSVFRNGVDIEIFKRDPVYENSVRRNWGINDDRFIFGWVGRLSEEKGCDIAIESFYRLFTKSEKPMSLVIVGEGNLKEHLLDLINKKGGEFGSHVIFTGFINCPWEVYSGFNVFINTSRFEGLPLSLLEAMSSSCPIIAMSNDCVLEIVKNREKLGWLVQPGDIEGVVKAMQEQWK